MEIFMDDGAATLIWFLIFLVLLIFDCICNGFRAATQHFNSVDLEEIDDADTKSEIHKILEEETAIRRTYLVYNTIFFTLSGILTAIYFQPFLSSCFSFATNFVRILMDIVLYVLVLYLLAVFCVFLPVKIGERKALKWLTKYYGFTHFIIAVLKPFTVPVNSLANLLLPAFKADPHEAVDAIDEDEIISMIDESHEQGNILESEAEMIHNIFEFDDKDAVDVMTQRLSVVALEASMKFEDALAFMLEENFSRFPVYEEDIDHLVGIVHIKDAMRLSRQKEYLKRSICAVDGLVRQLDTVPETMNINELLRQMQKTKEHMAAVVDEYGQISGIVTLEDILEEIVGEIEDEHDEEVAMIVAQKNGNFILNGMVPLEDVAEALHITFEVNDINTLNGFLISLIDKIPEDNETFEVTYGGYCFKVLSVSDKIIKTVLAVPLPATTDEEIKEER